MQTTERERLMRMTCDEAAFRVATLVKCGVCIGFLALLTVIGFSTSIYDAATPVAMSAGPENTSAQVGVRTEAHRKQVFDERRARFQATSPPQLALKPDRGADLEVTAP